MPVGFISKARAEKNEGEPELALVSISNVISLVAI